MESYSPDPESFLLTKELETLFYKLEFGTNEESVQSAKEISSLVPWKYSVFTIVDKLPDPVLRATSRQWVSQINKYKLEKKLTEISKAGADFSYDRLEEGVYLLSSIASPALDFSDFSKVFDGFAATIEELFSASKEYLTDEEKCLLLARVLHKEVGLTGNRTDYENDSNSYISKVLETKTGNPISMSVIYLLVGKRLGLPLHGVNMPLHFLVQYESPTFFTYIDPFHDGMLLDRETCNKFLLLNGYNSSKKYFAKADTITIFKRMYRNLIQIYRKKKDKSNESLCTSHLFILENKKDTII